MNDESSGSEERRRRLFLDEWQVGMHSLDESVRAAAQGAVDFAQTVLRTAAILNGGALVLIPGYLALTREAIDAEMHGAIVAVIVAFIVGLLLAWLSAAAAYFTMVLQAEANRETREALAKRLHAWFDAGRPGQFPELAAARWISSTKTAEQHDTASKRKWTWAECLRWSAVLLNFASFAAFVVGCWIGIAAVS